MGLAGGLALLGCRRPVRLSVLGLLGAKYPPSRIKWYLVNMTLSFPLEGSSIYKDSPGLGFMDSSTWSHMFPPFKRACCLAISSNSTKTFSYSIIMLNGPRGKLHWTASRRLISRRWAP